MRYFSKGTFDSSNQLVWVEFPEGLRVLKAYTFKGIGSSGTVNTPSLINSNLNGTIAEIQTDAIKNAWAPSLTTLIIGSEIQKIGSAGIVFSSMSDYNSARSSGINEIIIGTSDSKSKLTNANMQNEAIQGYFSTSPV